MGGRKRRRKEKERKARVQNVRDGVQNRRREEGTKYARKGEKEWEQE